MLDELSRGLESLIAEGDNILVVADATGRVLWRAGSRGVLGSADRLGFVEGAHWGEHAVGTNAIGTALMSNSAVQVFSAEHYSRSHHPWTCAGAPIKDPRTGHVIGVVDVSGPAATVHPTTVALVDAVARLAESHLREQHNRTLNNLRTVAAPILARIGSPALAVDPDGWVAAVDSPAAAQPDRAARGGRAGTAAVPDAWVCATSSRCPAAGWSGWPRTGWAPSRTSRGRRSICATLMRRRCRWSANPVAGGRTSRLRHAEILLALAVSAAGRTAPELADALYGDRSRVVTVRAELSRLRKRYVGLLAAQPYRIAVVGRGRGALPR